MKPATSPTPNASGSDAFERLKDLTQRILKVPKPKASKKKLPKKS
jgi:hypothetical protein